MLRQNADDFTTMDDALIQQLRQCRLDRPHVGALAASLPDTDNELDALIAGLIEAEDEAALTAFVLAAAVGGRWLDARHLPGAAPLLASLEELAVAAFCAQGDVVEALLEAVRRGQCGSERDACLLLLAGWICKTRGPDRPLPEELIPHARRMARQARLRLAVQLPLYALAEVTEDAALRDVLNMHGIAPPDDLVSAFIEHYCAVRSADPLAALPERADQVLHEGGTMRRAVSKIGRNAPCPCGSGRKYKNCCYNKDRERLRRSSEIAGVTVDEFDAQPEPFLTEDRIYALRGHKLARLRIDRVAAELQGLVLERLATFRHTQEVVEAWETLGWRPDLEDAWESCLFQFAEQGDRDALARLIAVRGLRIDDEAVPIEAQLLLFEDDPREYLRVAEEIAFASLRDTGDSRYIDVAHAMLQGRFPGLGTLVARGAAATGSDLDAAMLFHHIGLLRDRLNLPPEDPAEHILNDAFEVPNEIDELRREQLETARHELNVSTAEVARLREQLGETEASLEREERRAPAAEARPGDAASTSRDQAAPAAYGAREEDPAITAKLRRRITELKTALADRHAERNALRHELAKALSETDALRRRAAALADSAASGNDATDYEEDALLSEETALAQPPRLPVFPPRFKHTLESFPDNVARGALTLIGRLAAGDPSAFVGMRRLRVRRDVCRVRVGGSHRLFLRLEPGEIQVLDLIDRRDFERWLKKQG